MRINGFVPSEKVFEANFGPNKIEEDNDNISFASLLSDSLNEVNNKQIESDKATESFIRGDEGTSIENVMLNSTEAKLSLDLAVQVKIGRASCRERV